MAAAANVNGDSGQAEARPAGSLAALIDSARATSRHSNDISLVRQPFVQPFSRSVAQPAQAGIAKTDRWGRNSQIGRRASVANPMSRARLAACCSLAINSILLLLLLLLLLPIRGRSACHCSPFISVVFVVVGRRRSRRAWPVKLEDEGRQLSPILAAPISGGGGSRKLRPLAIAARSGCARSLRTSGRRAVRNS